MTADGFGSLKFAARLRAVVREMVQAELARQGTPARGTVVEINNEAKVAQIALPGAEESVPIALTGDARPAVAGAVVEIVGPPGNRRIGSVISDPRPEWNGGNVPDSGGEDDGDGGITGGPAVPTGLLVANNSAAFSIALSWNENTEVDMINGFGRYEVTVNLMLRPGQQEIQTLTITGTGTYKITFGGFTTSEAIPHDAPASEVSRIFTTLSSVGDNDVEITGTPGNYTFKWLRTLGNVAQPTTTALVGVSAATFATTQAGSADLDLGPNGVELSPIRVTANTLVAFNAPQNYKFKFKIRAVDAHGRRSDWTAYSDTVEVFPVRAIHIDPLSITETHISPDSIRSPMIQAETIQGNNIAARTIEAMHIVANTITADEIAASLVLVNQRIQSTSYDPGVLGWAIIDDGADDLAEFNNLFARGEIRTGDDGEAHLHMKDDSIEIWPAELAADYDPGLLRVSQSGSPPITTTLLRTAFDLGSTWAQLQLTSKEGASDSTAYLQADHVQLKSFTDDIILSAPITEIDTCVEGAACKGTFSVANGTTFNTVTGLSDLGTDNWNAHSSGTLTAPSSGVYLVCATAIFPAASGGTRKMRLTISGSATDAGTYDVFASFLPGTETGINNTTDVIGSFTGEFYLAAGNTLVMKLQQDKTAGTAMVVACRLSFRKVSR